MILAFFLQIRHHKSCFIKNMSNGTPWAQCLIFNKKCDLEPFSTGAKTDIYPFKISAISRSASWMRAWQDETWDRVF